MNINICKDFSETPGARYRNEGDFSGEQFREELLEPKFLEAKNNGEKIIINLDGGYGYTPSFLEVAFGGLSRKYGSDYVLPVLEFESNDEPSLIDEVLGYIKQAKKEGTA